MGDLFTKPDAKAGSINSGTSPDIWGQSPGAQIAAGDWGVGFEVKERFMSFLDTHNWVLTQDTTGTVAMDPAAKGGALTLAGLGAGAPTRPELMPAEFTITVSKSSRATTPVAEINNSTGG